MSCHPERSVLQRSRKPALSKVEGDLLNRVLGSERSLEEKATTFGGAALMRVWRICRAPYAAEAFSGEGARRFGGRWNSRGVPMVYCSSSLALAAIELFVHLEPNLQPDDLVSIAATLPTGEPARILTPADLPADWWTDDYEPLRALGDTWIREKSSLALQVPAAPLHSEWNVLLNPLHAAIKKLTIEPAEPFHFDARMFR